MHKHLVQLQNYRASDRRRDRLAICLFFALELVLIIRLGPSLLQHPGYAVLTALLGYLGADFVSGFVHWLGDTWGSFQTPILGRTFIRPFREHHVDPTAITRHDFTETNGSNCLVSFLALLPSVFFDLETSVMSIWFWAFLLFFTLGIFATNQFHKWAHDTKANRVIKFFQHYRLILSPEHHQIHHKRPFNQYYCITTGWLNGILSGIGFYRGMEWIITKTTGMKARQEDKVLAK